jgi:hypothetical protein
MRLSQADTAQSTPCFIQRMSHLAPGGSDLLAPTAGQVKPHKRLWETRKCPFHARRVNKPYWRKLVESLNGDH